MTNSPSNDRSCNIYQVPNIASPSSEQTEALGKRNLPHIQKLLDTFMSVRVLSVLERARVMEYIRTLEKEHREMWEALKYIEEQGDIAECDRRTRKAQETICSVHYI